MELTLVSVAGSTVRAQIEEIIKEHLAAVGIDLRIDRRPASVFFGEVTRKRLFAHMGVWSTLFSIESTGYEGFHSSQIPSEANNWEGFNAMGWRNPENDRLLDQISVELDESRRIQLLRRQQEIFADDLPALPLYFSLSLTTSRREIRHVRPTGLFGSFLPWNAYEWSWQE
jgi:peptide/nickel transport system substrate-binding protein